MKIILIGYMASGKSFIGKKLAFFLKYEFVDLDNYIENKEQMTIDEIFKAKGEVYFRSIEKNHLHSLLDDNKNRVISLGGGTPCYFDNIKYIKKKKNTTSLFLEASIKTLVNRVYSEKEKRPLIAHIQNRDVLSEFIGKHLFERNSFYNQADFKINTEKPSKEIIEEILLKLF